MLISHHSLPVGHSSLLGVLRAGTHQPGATMRLLLERILTMEHHGAGLTDILLLLLVTGYLLPVVWLVLMHGLMGWQWVMVWNLRNGRAMH